MAGPIDETNFFFILYFFEFFSFGAAEKQKQKLFFLADNLSERETSKKSKKLKLTSCNLL